jgi:hypothetical protein
MTRKPSAADENVDYRLLQHWTASRRAYAAARSSTGVRRGRAASKRGQRTIKLSMPLEDR